MGETVPQTVTAEKAVASPAFVAPTARSRSAAALRRRAADQLPIDVPPGGFGTAVGKVTKIDGVDVVEVVPVPSNLPSRAPTRVNQLIMADGNTLYGCRDCDYVGPSAGAIRKHRFRKHGANLGGRRKHDRPEQDRPEQDRPRHVDAVVITPPAAPPAAPPVEPVDEPRARAKPGPKPGQKSKVGRVVLPDVIASLTLAEIVETAETHARLAHMFELQEIQLQQWKDRALAAEKTVARLQANARTMARLAGFEIKDGE